MERAEKAEVVGQALAWPVIREADPALSSHSGKQSKQEFTIAGLSAPFTNSFPTSIQLSGRMCPELLLAISLLQHLWHSRRFQLEEAVLLQRSKMVLKKTIAENICTKEFWGME